MTPKKIMIMAIGAGVVIGLLVLVGIIFLLNISGSLGLNAPRIFQSPMMGPSNRPLQRYESNGERIYYTGTSASGDPIRADLPGMQRMMTGRMACVDCHGVDGRGGAFRMMMGSYTAPDIRYTTLTEEEHGGEEGEDEHEEHPPYTDETIKRAITEGLDPGGEALEWPMPRWQMSESDLNDLLTFLKTLE